jgi:hypothetical protein
LHSASYPLCAPEGVDFDASFRVEQGDVAGGRNRYNKLALRYNKSLTLCGQRNVGRLDFLRWYPREFCCVW